MISNVEGEDRTLYTIHRSMRRKSICPQKLFPRTPLGPKLAIGVCEIGPEVVTSSSRVHRKSTKKPGDGKSENNGESTSEAIIEMCQKMSVRCGESMIVWLDSRARERAGEGARVIARVEARVRASDSASERDASGRIKLIPGYCSSAGIIFLGVRSKGSNALLSSCEHLSHSTLHRLLFQLVPFTTKPTF